MPDWTHNVSSRGMTTREWVIVDRLHHIVDGSLAREHRPIVEDGLKLIIDLIRTRGKQRDLEEQVEHQHDD